MFSSRPLRGPSWPLRGPLVAPSWPLRGPVVAPPGGGPPCRGPNRLDFDVLSTRNRLFWDTRQNLENPPRGVVASSWPRRSLLVASSWPPRGLLVASSWPRRGLVVASSWPRRGLVVASSWPRRVHEGYSQCFRCVLRCLAAPRKPKNR